MTERDVNIICGVIVCSYLDYTEKERLCTLVRTPVSSAPTPACGWLLVETWRDKSVHHEGVALTPEAKDSFIRGDYEEGHSRSALPLKIWALTGASACVRGDTRKHDAEDLARPRRS